MALWYLLFCSKVHQNSQTMHWISNWLLKPGGMLFFSREWLENFSELFLVRKVDFLKLNSVRKLILERKKKNPSKKTTPIFYKERDSLTLYSSKKTFFFCRTRQEQTYAFSIWHYSAFKHFQDGFHPSIFPFKLHKNTKDLISVCTDWKIKACQNISESVCSLPFELQFQKYCWAPTTAFHSPSLEWCCAPAVENYGFCKVCI